MLPPAISELCQGLTVSSELAKNPGDSPGDIALRLYNSSNIHVHTIKPPKERSPASAEDLDRAAKCGQFGDAKPSELFLRAFHDVLRTLEHDPLAGVVSPPLIGTTGVVPMTVIGPLNDIARHMSNLIARAKKEVFLATNYWTGSGGARIITDGLLELSRRAGERGDRAVVKILYDRGNIKQFFDHHQPVPPSIYTGKAVQIPHPDDIPNIDLEVVNYHRPLLGTFHAKFMIVDREIAIAQSNNIQDNDNLEMMSQLEGPIVDSIFDCFIISWHNAFKPHTQCHNTPAVHRVSPTFQDEAFKGLFESNGVFRMPPLTQLPEHLPGEPHYDESIAAEISRMNSVLSPQDAGETHVQVVCRHLNKPVKQTAIPTADCPESSSDQFFPYIVTPPHPPVPMALVSRKPFGHPTHTSVYNPQNEAFLSLIRNANSNIFIQTPDLNASPLLPALTDAVNRGITVTYYVCQGYNDAGELLPGQGGTNEQVAHKLYQSIDPAFHDRLRVHYYVAKDQIHPIHNKFKARSCHIKLMIVDDAVAIQGSGNQDTQTWFQSQEVNVMIDSQEICRIWRAGIERNQNTGKFGRAGTDGVWRDVDGNPSDGASSVERGRFDWMKGVVGAVNRVRGVGGF